MAKNRIVYGLIFIMTAMFVFLYENQATYAALYAVLLIPIVSLTVLFIGRRGISISEKLDDCTIKKGEVAKYAVNVSHNVFNFKTKVIFEKSLREIAQIIESGEKDCFEIVCKYRGSFNVSAEYVLIYDLLGLFKMKLKNPNTLNLTVLPNIIHLENLQVSFNHAADSAKANGMTDNDSDFPDFKKYEPTDGYKRINWQLSARRGELISKNYNASEKTTAAVIIDNSQMPDKIKRIEAMRCEDSMIEAALAVIAYCNEMNMPVYLDFLGGTAGTASLEFDTLYALAADIQFDSQEDFHGFLTSITEERKSADNIYIFTREVKKPLIDCAERLRSSGCNALIFYYNYDEGKCKLWF